MYENWDVTFKLPRSDLGKRIDQIRTLSGNQELRSRLTRDLLDHADNNVYITVGGLVMVLNITMGTFRAEQQPIAQSSFDAMAPYLFRELTEALIDNPAIRKDVLEALCGTNGIPLPG